MVRFVFDFETMGQNPDAVVLSMALTFFDDRIKSFNEYVETSYYWKFDIDHQVEQYGRTIDKSTLDWWEKQDKEVRESQFAKTEDDVTLVEFVEQLRGVLLENNVDKNSLGFVRGQSFDFPILTHIINQVKSEISSFKINPAFFPIPFWNQRDIRSYIAGLLVSPDITKCPLPDGTLPGFEHHDPIHDNARAILMIQYAEMYANGEMEVPDEQDWDKNSMV